MSSEASTSTLASYEESEEVSGTNMLSLPGEKTPQEARLEREGCFRSLQVFRYNLYQKENISNSEESKKILAAVIDLLYYEDELRRNCQTEIALRQQKKRDMSSNKRSPSFEKDMSKLGQDNWLKARGWWWSRGWMMSASGPLGRAFELWRSNDVWFMHPVLVEDCKARGGCCGRDCGCCRDDQRANSLAGVLGAGHCTLECGCCLESRNFDPSMESKSYYVDRFSFDAAYGAPIDFQTDPYRRRFYLAAIWGLSVSDSH